MHICQHICLIRNMNLYPHLCADQECFVLDVGASNVRGGRGGHIFDYVHFKKIKIFMDFFREGGGSTRFLYLNPRIQLNVATIEDM